MAVLQAGTKTIIEGDEGRAERFLGPQLYGCGMTPSLVWRLRNGSRIHIYMSNRKNPGNTKYVFDGHWFMEIDGNC